MKKVFTDSIVALKETCKNDLSFVLIVVFAVSSFFTKFSFSNENFFVAIVDLMYFCFSAVALIVVLIVFLFHFEKYLNTTKLSKCSIESLFTTDARHASVNLVTMLQLISLILVIISITTGHIYAAEVSVWFVTGVAMRLVYN